MNLSPHGPPSSWKARLLDGNPITLRHTLPSPPKMPCLLGTARTKACNRSVSQPELPAHESIGRAAGPPRSRAKRGIFTDPQEPDAVWASLSSSPSSRGVESSTILAESGKGDHEKRGAGRGQGMLCDEHTPGAAVVGTKSGACTIRHKRTVTTGRFLRPERTSFCLELPHQSPKNSAIPGTTARARLSCR